MSPVFKAVVLFAVAAVLCAATFFLVPRLRNGSAESGMAGADGGEEVQEDATTEADVSRTTRTRPSSVSVREQTERDVSAVSPLDREKAKFDVAEMRNEVEDMVRKFRGTPEERQDVIDECEEGKELIRLIADLSEQSIDNMSPEELEKERESFEKDYRAQLDFLQTGQLQRMLKTPEEREVIGSTIDTVRDFLERLDEALHSAGY